MPVLSWGHSNYWARDTAGPAPGVARAGYAPWQMSSFHAATCGSLWGGLQIAWEPVCQRWQAWRWMANLLWRLRRLDPTARRRVDRCLPDLLSCHTPAQELAYRRAGAAITNPSFLEATRLVRETATTLGFNHQEAWQALEYSRTVKRSRRDQENTYRHLRVAYGLQTLTLNRPETHLLAELAYHGFARGPVFGILVNRDQR